MADATTGTTDFSSTLGSLGSGISGLLSLAGPLYSMFGSGPTSASGNSAAVAQAADPFASQRFQYQKQLQNLMTNPSSFALSPAAQSQMQQGSENLSRQMAAQGFLGSGNILAGLQQYGQGIANQDYYNQLNELNLLSGAQTGSPSAAALGISNLYGNQQQNLENLTGALSPQTGALAGGLGSLFVGSSGSVGDLSNIGSFFSGTGSDTIPYTGGGTDLTSGFNYNDLSGVNTSSLIPTDTSGFSDLFSSGAY